MRPSEVPSPNKRGLGASRGVRVAGRYELEREGGLPQLLGEGAQSVVEMGVDVRNGEKVALKIVKNHRKIEYPVSDYFREVWILKELLPVHECIVELKDVISERDTLYLVFEACDCDLRQFLKAQGPLKHEEYRMASLHLWAALDHMHSRRICHRDLKPCNILIKEGYLKIADFGLAKHVPERMSLAGGGSRCPMTREVASLWYRAPEVCWEGGRVGGEYDGLKLDIWGLGCVLYELGVGRALFVSESEQGLLAKIAKLLGGKGERVLEELKRQEMEDEMRAIVMECLQVDPVQRTLTAQQVLSRKNSYYHSMLH